MLDYIKLTFQSIWSFQSIKEKNNGLKNSINIYNDNDHHHHHHENEWIPMNTNNNNDNNYFNDKQNLIEGVDDDVVVIFSIFFVLVFLFIYYLITRFDHFTSATFTSSSSAVTSSLLIDSAQQQQQTSTLLSNSTNNTNSSNMFHRQRHFNSMDSNCPVCLNPFLFPVETNCGHLFCGQCVIVYWQQSQWRGGPIKCPVCRQQVNILLPCFQVNHNHSNNNNSNTESIGANGDSSSSDQNNTSNSVDTARHIISQINSYNRRFSGEPRPWYDYLYDLPTMLRHMSNDFFSFSGLFYMFRLRIIFCFIAAILYLISPLDMIPEAVFGIFGLIDDIVVVVLLAIYVTIIYRRFLSSRWGDD